MLYGVNNEITLIGEHLQNADQIQFTMINTLTMSNGLAYTSTALNELTAKFLDLKIGLDQMRKGYLSTNLVLPKTILNLIQTIINKNLKALWPATDSFIVPMYKFIKVQSLPHDNLSFLIQIPLEGVPSIRQGYHMIRQVFSAKYYLIN